MCVGLPPATAVYTLLHRAAARAGQALVYRVVVSGFDAALRVVQANLGVSVIPAQVAAPRVATGEIATVALSDDWAQRRFAVCSRAAATLTPAAARMIEFLVRQAAQADGPDGDRRSPPPPGRPPATRRRGRSPAGR